jgi:putative hydrolase of the HAD superfamily
MSPRAILFDLDNTLTPRPASIARFAEIFASDFAALLEPMSLEELLASLIEHDHGGYNPRRAQDLHGALPWRDAPPAAELAEHWKRRFPDAVVAMPGLEEVLSELAADGWLQGIVTNGPVTGQNAKIDRLGVRRFMQTVVTSEGAGCKKPEARIFELACEELGVRPSECWFVGDHPLNDVLGAADVGMTAVWITDPVGGHPWPEGQAAPAHRIESLRELPGLVSEVA